MARVRSSTPKHRTAANAEWRSGAVRAERRLVALGKRARGTHREDRSQFIPPENWHEPGKNARTKVKYVVQSAGTGLFHPLTVEQIKERLAELPSQFVKCLEVVQLSRMTRKKRAFPCYGMQWGTAIYLYPVDEAMVEHYAAPPTPAVFNEVRMFGGIWKQSANEWSLHWTTQSLQDFYLNNVLIHELGHIIDHRNSSFRDRERFAEWFAIEYGYRPTQAARQLRRQQTNAS